MENGAAQHNGKRRLRKILYVYTALILALIFCSKTIYNYALPKVTVIIPQAGRLNKELESYGVIEFAETIDICADEAGRINELLIQKGGAVTPGMAIARLAAPDASAAREAGYAADRINNRLAGLHLSKVDIERKLAALNPDPAEMLPYENALADAQTAFDRAQTEYNEVAAAVSENNPAGLGQTGYAAASNQAAADALRDWSKKKSGLQNARDELERITNSEGEEFDGYAYQLDINTAEINLERKQNELEKAKAALTAARNARENFDGYEYEKAVNAAQSAYRQSQQDYDNAVAYLYNAENYYNNLLLTGGNGAAVTQAEQDKNAAFTALRAAELAMNTQGEAYQSAVQDRERAQNTFQSNSADAKAQAVEAAEDAVEQAENAVTDAERALDIAKEALERAEAAFEEQQTANKADERDAAGQKVTDAQAAADDAEYIYTNALANAEKEAVEQLEAAGLHLTEAQTALDRAGKNLEIAAANQHKAVENQRQDYKLQLNRLALETELAHIDLLSAQPPEDGPADTLTSGYGGVIVSVDKKVGQYAAVGERVAVAGVASGAFVCEIVVPGEDARFIAIGDTAAIRQSGAAAQTEARVTDITREGNMLRFKLALESETFSGGEYVNVKFIKQSIEYAAVVPSEAVVSNPVSSYVWVLETKQGALGTEYYTRKAAVLIAGKDGFYTAIATGLDSYRPVVLSYDKEPAVNGRVSRMP